MKKYGRDASTIEASRGDAFAIELEGRPTAGYRWQAEVPAGVVRLRGSDVHPGGDVGGSATELLTFEAVETGEVVIQLVYKRPWDSEAHETREVRVKVS